ncbi:hypothetical protein TPY_2658 [Sulfobacillus acidophilus TPY]|uniref:Uncharacterized protein n=1 Tax=Sulfobacillus acidophilus (strain ATCC 700253 / DSM 10332 / NAL) TaxID=679936 RepID=G8TV82_SULAD|nr:hypothetical protein TPY_2658 [Sulfobacillus acidophilus TPY]AEW04722.1 hypothetical protein Sulac_1222 [Sulfobacillus acidophilus DSM 10332]
MSDPQRIRWRRGFYLGVFVAVFLFTFLIGWHVALAKNVGNGSGNTPGDPCNAPNPPTYCHQSNWNCVGHDVGGCVNNQQEVVYPSGCSPSVQYFSCSNGTCQGKSVFLSCTGCGTGLFEPTNSCTGGRNGANYQGPASWCTTGCHTQSPTPPTTSSQPPPTSSQPPPSSSNPPPGSSQPPSTPQCTPSTSTSCSAPLLTSCTGSCTTTGCSNTGEASGVESCTTYITNADCTTSVGGSYDQWVTVSTSACQAVKQQQCAYAQPGYAITQYCLSGLNGGVVNCSGWSSPQYDPAVCPVPTPIN